MNTIFSPIYFQIARKLSLSHTHIHTHTHHTHYLYIIPLSPSPFLSFIRFTNFSFCFERILGFNCGYWYQCACVLVCVCVLSYPFYRKRRRPWAAVAENSFFHIIIIFWSKKGKKWGAMAAVAFIPSWQLCLEGEKRSLHWPS